MLKDNAIIFDIKLFGFTLIELLIVMVIAGILGSIGINSYMATLRIERRQDAILSMKKAMLIILDNPTGAVCPDPEQGSSTVLYTDTENQNTCLSSNGFYHIRYKSSGYSIPPIINANDLQNDELLILKAIAVITKSQGKDNDICQTIYLSSKNNIYPQACDK
jgi:prepilin-type N-terminal cleavage/methylation domain-containing protein